MHLMKMLKNKFVKKFQNQTFNMMDTMISRFGSNGVMITYNVWKFYYKSF